MRRDGLDSRLVDATRSPAGSRRGGMTLLELVVVVAVLAVLATVVTPRLGQVLAGAPRDATLTSMNAVRAAIVGSGGGASTGFKNDLRAWPRRVGELIERDADRQPFDPATRLGWRGPYLTANGGHYLANPAMGFTDAYGAPTDHAVLDGWGNPIVLQVPDADGDGATTPEDLTYVRLVSAGADGRLTTPRVDAQTFGGSARVPTREQCGDDLVLYLAIADPRRPSP